MLCIALLSTNVFDVWLLSAISFEAGSSVYLGLRVHVACRSKLENSKDLAHRNILRQYFNSKRQQQKTVIDQLQGPWGVGQKEHKGQCRILLSQMEREAQVLGQNFQLQEEDGVKRKIFIRH